MPKIWRCAIGSCSYVASYTNFVGQIHPASSKDHRFVLVTTDYFTRWTKAVLLKNMTHKEVIHFILEHIVHRFSIPQTMTTDQGSLFVLSSP
jgi:hypothetical protein